MKNSFLILFLLSFSPVIAQKHSMESLINDFSSGKLFIINELAIAEADSTFFNVLATLDITSYSKVGPKEGKKSYGTLGEKGVFKLEVKDTSKFKDIYVGLVDASVLKYFNQKDSLLYMTDGAPNKNIYYALDILINKTIESVQIINKNEAMAIWGKEAENGAININCNREKELTLYK